MMSLCTASYDSPVKRFASSAVISPSENARRTVLFIHGAVKDRHQVFNPKTEQWVKVDDNTNLFMDVKQDGTP